MTRTTGSNAIVTRQIPRAAVVFAALVASAVGQPTPPLTPARKLETVRVTADAAPLTADGTFVAEVGKGRTFGVLDRKDGAVAIQVCLGTDLRRVWIDARNVAPFTDRQVNLARTAVNVATARNPKLDVAAAAAKLDTLIGRLASAASKGTTPRERVKLLGEQLFEQEGYRLAPLERMDRANSMDHLLEHKEGDCLTLSVLYVAAARKARLPLYLVYAPQHVFVRYEAAEDRFNIETMAKGKIYDHEHYLVVFRPRVWAGGVGGIDLLTLPDVRACGVLDEHAATYLAQARQDRAAETVFARAAEINPRSGMNYLNWAMHLCRQRRWKEACRIYAQAAEVAPKYAEAQIRWGAALVEMGQAEQADRKFAKAYEIAPGFVEAYQRRAALLERMGKPADACALYAKIAELCPKEPEAYNAWASLLVKMGNGKAAREAYAVGAKHLPNDARFRYDWGSALVGLGRSAEACGKFQEAVKLKPDYPVAYFAWGVTLGMMGRKAEAVKKLDKAVELDRKLKGQADQMRKRLGL